MLFADYFSFNLLSQTVKTAFTNKTFIFSSLYKKIGKRKYAVIHLSPSKLPSQAYTHLANFHIQTV